MAFSIQRLLEIRDTGSAKRLKIEAQAVFFGAEERTGIEGGLGPGPGVGLALALSEFAGGVDGLHREELAVDQPNVHARSCSTHAGGRSKRCLGFCERRWVIAASTKIKTQLVIARVEHHREVERLRPGGAELADQLTALAQTLYRKPLKRL